MNAQTITKIDSDGLALTLDALIAIQRKLDEDFPVLRELALARKIPRQVRPSSYLKDGEVYVFGPNCQDEAFAQVMQPRGVFFAPAKGVVLILHSANMAFTDDEVDGILVLWQRECDEKASDALR